MKLLDCWRFSLFVLLAVGLTSQKAAARSDQYPVDAPQVRIPETSVRPNIDGVIDPAEWAQAIQIQDLWQVSPVEFASPTEKTRFYWMYDERAIYVAAFAEDTDLANISAYTLSQGGDLASEDRMAVLINPYDNNRTAYQFTLNANGVRGDGLFNGANVSFDWEGIWQGASAIHEDGWSAEWAIPFNTLSFDPANENWRINMLRAIPRYNEEIGWRSANGQVNPTAMGLMTGVTEVSQGRGLDLIPSFSSSFIEQRQANTSALELNPSLDVAYKLTPSLNLTLTLNTDFAGTELDGRQLNLDRFNPSLPEKRSFFLADFDIFEFGPASRSGASNGAPFFSRRIGLSGNGESIDIIGGIKVSGRVGDYDVGSLLIRQDAYDQVEAADLLITRVSRSILDESSMGFIWTFGDPGSNESSATYGVDFNYLNSQAVLGRRLELRSWAQQSSNDSLQGRDSAWQVFVAMPSSQGWEMDASITSIEENFDPRLGFVNRPGVLSKELQLSHNSNLENFGVVQRYGVNLQYREFSYLDNGELQSRLLQLRPFRIQSHAGDVLAFMWKQYSENLRPQDTPFRRLGANIPTAQYDFLRPRVFARTSNGRPLIAEMAAEWGEFYNGERVELRTLLTWQANRHLTSKMELNYNKYEFPDVTAEITQVELGLDYAFNSSWSLNNLVQYDTLTRNIGINSRLRWNLQAGRDIWFVLNHSEEDADGDGRFSQVESSATFKIRYTYRY